jgi:hypothetical protein
MAIPISMTVTQMIDAWLIEYDRIIAQVAQSYTDDEIISFLNRAQEEVVGELYQSRHYDLLGSLYTIATVASPTSMSTFGIPNGYYVLRSDDISFPLGVMFFVDVSVTATRTNLPAGSEVTLAEWIDRDVAKHYIKDLSNNQVLFRIPKIYTQGQYLVVLVDAFTNAPSSINVQFIRYPLNLVKSGAVSQTTTTTSELPALLHKSIVTKAVYIAKEITDRVQQTKQS